MSQSTCRGTRAAREHSLTACCSASRTHQRAYPQNGTPPRRIEPLERPQQPDDRVLFEIGQIHAPARVARRPPEQRQARRDEPRPRLAIPADGSSASSSRPRSANRPLSPGRSNMRPRPSTTERLSPSSTAKANAAAEIPPAAPSARRRKPRAELKASGLTDAGPNRTPPHPDIRQAVVRPTRGHKLLGITTHRGAGAVRSVTFGRGALGIARLHWKVAEWNIRASSRR